jgi:hypothetical protein
MKEGARLSRVGNDDRLTRLLAYSPSLDSWLKKATIEISAEARGETCQFKFTMKNESGTLWSAQIELP